MRWMGWSWTDLKRTPSSVVAVALDRMQKHTEAQNKANKRR